MNLLLSPHNDDSELFASYTILREKPLVVICTDSYIQFERGDPITATQRRQETLAAAKILGCRVEFLGIKDTEINEQNLTEEFKKYSPGRAYAPAIQGGNWQHDLVGQVANQLFPNVIHYMTYTKTELWTKGSVEIIPTQEEIDLKNRALDCYQSQINLGATAPHFKAVRNRSEWYV